MPILCYFIFCELNLLCEECVDKICWEGPGKHFSQIIITVFFVLFLYVVYVDTSIIKKVVEKTFFFNFSTTHNNNKYISSISRGIIMMKTNPFLFIFLFVYMLFSNSYGQNGVLNVARNVELVHFT